MDNVQNKVAEPTAEEKQQEEELLKETPADEIRQSVVEKFGLTEGVDDDLIDKLAESETEQRKKLSTAIKQKISWRDKATAPKEPKIEETPQPQVKQPVLTDEILDKKLVGILEERDWQSLEESDELKSQLKTYAKAGGLTVKQALSTPYYKFIKTEEEQKQKVEEASIGGKRRAPSSKEYSYDSPPQPDMFTKEGREEWAKYQKWLKNQ